MADRNTRRIFNNLVFRLSVLTGERRVILSRENHKIDFSESEWMTFTQNLPFVKFAIHRNCILMFTLDKESGIKVSVDQNKDCKLVICNKTGAEIGLNKDEIEELDLFLMNMSHLFNQDIWYSTGAGEWHVLREAAVLEGVPGKLAYRLAPRMCDENIATRLAAYLIINKIKQQRQENKFKESWSRTVFRYFDDTLKSTDIKAKISELNRKMDWNVSMPDEMCESRLFLLIEGKQKTRICPRLDQCHVMTDIDLVYDRLFMYLEL